MSINDTFIKLLQEINDDAEIAKNYSEDLEIEYSDLEERANDLFEENQQLREHLKNAREYADELREENERQTKYIEELKAKSSDYKGMLVKLNRENERYKRFISLIRESGKISDAELDEADTRAQDLERLKEKLVATPTIEELIDLGVFPKTSESE